MDCFIRYNRQTYQAAVSRKGCVRMLFQEYAVRGRVNRKRKIDRLRYKKERNGFWKDRQHLLPPKSSGQISEKVSLCTPFKKKFKRASMTVECALVLPLFFLGVITMISFMDLYRVQTEHLTKLCQKAKTAGAYMYVTGGSVGEEITLPDAYAYEAVGGLVPLPKIWTYNRVRIHTWTGTEHKTAAGTDGGKEPEQMVYMTDAGEVFHKSLSCSYLNLSVTQVSGSRVSSLRNDYGEKYYPCESCSKGKKAAGAVFITEKGNRYHNRKDCSGLKRTVRLVRESETKGLHACSRCG